MSSPTQRTLARLKHDDWTATIVEHWNPHARIRQDLFGIIDVLAVHPTRGILGIQCTSGGHGNTRVDKAIAEPRLIEWLRAGGKFEVWEWRKLGAKGKRKRYSVRACAIKYDKQLTAEEWVELV